MSGWFSASLSSDYANNFVGPSGNALEFKAFADMGQLFAK
jgi:extradiol dioxygenase family protein